MKEEILKCTIYRDGNDYPINQKVWVEETADDIVIETKWPEGLQPQDREKVRLKVGKWETTYISVSIHYWKSKDGRATEYLVVGCIRLPKRDYNPRYPMVFKAGIKRLEDGIIVIPHNLPDVDYALDRHILRDEFAKEYNPDYGFIVGIKIHNTWMDYVRRELKYAGIHFKGDLMDRVIQVPNEQLAQAAELLDSINHEYKKSSTKFWQDVKES